MRSSGWLILGVAFLFVQARISTQVEFVTERYESTDTTGRGQSVGPRVVALPLRPDHAGRLRGAHDRRFRFSQCLSWQHGSKEVCSASCCFRAPASCLIFSHFSVIRSRAPTEVQDLGRLFLGLTLALIAGAFFEVKLYSPSNILIFTLTIASIAIRPLRAWRHGLVPGTAPQVGELQPGPWARVPGRRLEREVR